MEDTYRSQFRLPYSLYELLKKSAADNHRSVNAELVARLQDSFSPHPSQATASATTRGPTTDELIRLMHSMSQQIADLSLELQKVTAQQNATKT